MDLREILHFSVHYVKNFLQSALAAGQSGVGM